MAEGATILFTAMGGAGNDRLEGGDGNDVYLFGRGDGHDAIYEFDSRSDRRNVIRLGEGLGPDDVDLLTTNRNGNYMDLVIRIKSTGETLTVPRGLSDYYTNQHNSYSIQAIEFADGTVWTYEDITKKPRVMGDSDLTIYAEANGSHLIGNSSDNILYGMAGNDVLHGGGGNDTLRGDYGNDILWGGAGNDRLEGGFGDDVYRFGRGDGHDVVYDYEYGRPDKRNMVNLGEGIGVDDIELLVKQNSSSYTDLIIRIKDTGETLTIDKAIGSNITNANNYYSIQGIAFADGTVWEWADIVKRPVTIMDSSGSVYADTLGSFIIGNAGNNIIYGGNGQDVLHGGEGDDTLSGGAGNDILWGGAGNDRLEGGIDDDVYLFGRGDGHDVVYDYEYNRPGKRNVVSLGEGIGADDIEFLVKQNASGGYTDLVIRIKDTGETLTLDKAIQNNYANANNSFSIQAITFADGTVWEWADIVKRPVAVMDGSGSVYADTLGSFIIGNAGNNIIYGGVGSDVLYGGDGDDTLYGGNGDDVLHGDTGNDYLSGENGNDVLHGGAGDDILSGGVGNDILWGGAGNDRLEGSIGDDVYFFGRGDGHDVVYDYEYGRSGKRNVVSLGEGIGSGDIEFLVKQNASGGYTDLVIRIKDTGETLTLDKAIQNNYANANNSFSIQAITFADGTVWEWADILKRPLIVSDGMTSASGDVSGSFIQGNDSNNTINGSGAADILYGGGGNDTLYGGNGNDILWGGKGKDRLEGGYGDDAYLFGRGDGHDVVYEYDPNRTANRRNVIRLGEKIGVDDVDFLLKQNVSTSYTDLVIRIKDTGETLTIDKAIGRGITNANNYYSIQAIEFADGTVLEWDSILHGGDGADTLYGKDGGGVLYGGAGNDTLSAGNGNDIVHGDAGNDTLFGGAGNDILWGDAGDDRLDGGAGDDVYVFGKGDGNDVVDSDDADIGKSDGIRLVGLTSRDVDLLANEHGDFIVRIKETGESITVLDGMNGVGSGIQFIEFSNGTRMDWAEIENRINNGNGNQELQDPQEFIPIINGTNLDDQLIGTSGDDIILGGKGNDELYGGQGNDTYIFKRGDGHDVIAEVETRADRRNVIRLGEGIGASDIELLIKALDDSSSDFIIRIKDTGETLTVSNGMYRDLANASYSGAIQAIEFADGTAWEWSDILAQPLQIAEGSYNNSGYSPAEGGMLVGNDANNIIHGSLGKFCTAARAMTPCMTTATATMFFGVVRATTVLRAARGMTLICLAGATVMTLFMITSPAVLPSEM